MKPTPQTPIERVAIFAALGCLLVALLVGIGPNWSGRIMALGDVIWDDYGAELRVDPFKPDCELTALEQELQDCPEETSAPPPPSDVGNPFDSDAPPPDPFADDAPPPDPFADDAPPPDPFADDAPPPDPFAGDSNSAAGDTNRASLKRAAEPKNCAALKNFYAGCVAEHEDYAQKIERITSSILIFRKIDNLISALGTFPYTRHLLLIFLGLSALTTTLTRVHISIRNPETRIESMIAEGAMLLGHLLLTASAIAHIRIQRSAEMEIEHPMIPYVMAFGFGAMAIVNAVHVYQAVSERKGSDSFSVARALMVIPLHAYMAVVTGAYFLLLEAHPSGQAIYIEKFAQHPNIYLGIGLYIWSGMLLANTRIAKTLFELILPWNLPPTVLAWLVVVAAAYPTAYSGASGIFVIAAGAVIFSQLRVAGASSRLALTATAMSGSLGVVLNPCLVIVLIAILNKQVTTSELFGWGQWVFALTAALFLIAMLGRWAMDGFSRPTANTTFTTLDQRIAATSKAFLALLPYGLIAVGVLAAVWLFTDTLPDERTAPFVLPVVLIALVAYDRWSDPNKDTDPSTFIHRLIEATSETAHHSGALLMVMAASVGFGGLIERSELMDAMPSSFGSPVATMAILVIVMVIVGMTMDALGAVVLVSVSVAGLAYDNGIDPVHFWMMVLVAFELGYLTPPVAINHLLARQVIGEESWVEKDNTTGFFRRYEHIILPMGVMTAALLLVAFVPFAWYP